MLRLLRSILGRDNPGTFPESRIKQSIELAVDGTDPSIRAVSGYRKILRPAVAHAIEHVEMMADSLPPPVPVHFDNGRQRPLKGYFISAAEMREVFARDRALADYLNEYRHAPPRIIALLGMERQEKGSFGAALCGDMVALDIPQATVTFADHRLYDPSGDEAETLGHLKRRAFDHLLALALGKLAAVKSERHDLQRRRTLLQSKLNLLQREGWGGDDAKTKHELKEAEERLAQVEEQFAGVGGDFGENEVYLQIVADVLGHAEQHLNARCDTVFVNQVGVKQTAPASDVHELCFMELRNSAGRNLVVMLVSLQTEEVRRLVDAASL